MVCLFVEIKVKVMIYLICLTYLYDNSYTTGPVKYWFALRFNLLMAASCSDGNCVSKSMRSVT